MSEGSGWVQAIREVLRDGLSISDAVLREDDPRSKCKPVQIRRSGKSVIVSFNAQITLSERREPVCIKDVLFPLFKEQEGVTRMCDYWILTEQGEESPVLYVLLCELKSGRSRGLAQIENGRLLAEYLIKMVAHHRGLDPGEVQFRGIVWSHHHRAMKAGLRPGKIPYEPSGRLSIPIAYLRDGSEWSLSALCA